MGHIDKIMPLSKVKATLSEVVRTVSKTGAPVVITVDGQPVVKLVPATPPLRQLSSAEVAAYRALTHALVRVPRQVGSFDAVTLIGEGRR